MFWCPLDAKQDKLPAFLGTESFSGRQTQVTDTQEIPLTYPRTNRVIILPWFEVGKQVFVVAIIIDTAPDSNWFFSEKIDCPRLMGDFGSIAWRLLRFIAAACKCDLCERTFESVLILKNHKKCFHKTG